MVCPLLGLPFGLPVGPRLASTFLRVFAELFLPLDAPEIDQNCLGEGGVYPCGQFALEALEGFVANRRIRCEDLGQDPKYPRRRIGRCAVDGIDLHRWLVGHGWALNFEPYARGRFKDDEQEARERGAGMWRGCFVAPRDFRRWNKHTAPLLGSHCPGVQATGRCDV